MNICHIYFSEKLFNVASQNKENELREETVDSHCVTQDSPRNRTNRRDIFMWLEIQRDLL